MSAGDTGRMAAQLGNVQLEMLFGRAFLLELERGNLENAAVFARAFLRHHGDRAMPN